MPYLVAYTLLHGRPGPASYTTNFLTDRNILALIDKMKFTISDRFDQLYPEHLPFRIEMVNFILSISARMFRSVRKLVV